MTNDKSTMATYEARAVTCFSLLALQLVVMQFARANNRTGGAQVGGMWEGQKHRMGPGEAREAEAAEAAATAAIGETTGD